MVKGEHLRPLLGFALVCVTAVLIMGTGLSTPSLSGIVAAPEVRAVPAAPDLVLGQTLDNASPTNHGSVGAGRSSDSPAAPTSDQRVTAVLASLSLPAGAEAAPSPTTSSTPVHHAKAVKHRKPHRNSTPVTPAPKPPTSAPAAAPTPQPLPQPAPEPVHGSGHGSGHGAGHGVGHGSRNDSKHATRPGLVTTIVRHLDEQAQHGSGTGRHGDHASYAGGHSHHHGDDGATGHGRSGHGGDPYSGHGHSGYGSTSHGRHR
jgi:hypothetical protein